MVQSAVPVVLVTSIPPTMSRYEDGQLISYDYQQLCIQSWVACKMHVLSVNEPNEIEVLSKKYPLVDFKSAEISVKISGRKSPAISDLLSALEGTSEPIACIVNSDIILESTPIWSQSFPNLP